MSKSNRGFLPRKGDPSRMLGIASDLSGHNPTDDRSIKLEVSLPNAFRDVPVALAITRIRDQRYREVNQAFELLTGWHRDEVIGNTVLDLALGPDPVRWQQIVQRVRSEGNVRDCELRYHLRSGMERFGLSSATMLTIGNEPCILWSMVDITSRKHAEETLHARETELEESQRLAQVGSWQWDPKTRELKWSKELYRIYGLDPSLPPPRYEELALYFKGDSWQRLHEAMESSIQTGSVPVVESELIRPDKTARWVTIRIQPVRDSSGKILYLHGTTQDITQSKRTQQQLRESEERFRLVADHAAVMIWMTGTDRMCEYVNKRWLDFTGRSLEAETGDGWWDMVHPEDLSRGKKMYIEMFDRKESLKLDYRLRRHDGEYRWISNTGVPRFNRDGSFAGYIGSCIDVTEHKNAQDALASIGRRLIEAHEEERTWIARELHDDINQRLALLAVELERWNQNAPPTAESAERGHRAQQRLLEIAKDIQRLSHRLHSSKLEYLGLATAAKSFCKEVSEENMVQVSFRQTDVPRILSKDISLSLFRVLQEALQNAVKHSGVRTFQVELHGSPNEIALSVADTGRGFDENEVLRAKGLGLISMRERLQLVNGELSVKSNPGGGTVISARVPLKVDQPRVLAG